MKRWDISSVKEQQLQPRKLMTFQSSKISKHQVSNLKGKLVGPHYTSIAFRNIIHWTHYLISFLIGFMFGWSPLRILRPWLFWFLQKHHPIIVYNCPISARSLAIKRGYWKPWQSLLKPVCYWYKRQAASEQTIFKGKTLLSLNFANLAKQYFTVFCLDFNRQKGHWISRFKRSQLHLFFKSVNFLKFLDKVEEAKPMFKN